MSLSKIYKGGASQSFQPLGFAEFGSGAAGGGMVPGTGEFKSASAPRGIAGHGGEAPAADQEKRVREAFAEGRKAALDEAEERFGGAAKALASALEDISRLRESILKNSTDDMLRLVMVIAEQVISCELSINPEIIHHTMKKALQAAVRSDEYHIRLNPADLAVAKEKKPLLLAGISGLKNLTIEADPSVSRGGCLVESELGEVDATISSQLEEIRQKTLQAAMGE